MSTPLNFKTQSSGGAYGTHSSNKNGTARQRRNPADYGPFSSPNGSFDDPFPPYAELPYTSLKRRRHLQEHNSIVKWAMKAVLMSPVIVVVLWGVGTVMFAKNHHINNGSGRRQSRRNSRNQPNFYGNGGQNNMVMAGMPQQQLAMQDQQGNLIYNVNGNAMMMAPMQAQQQLQMSNGQLPTNNLLMTNGYQQQQQGGTLQMMQKQGNPISVEAPLGNAQNSNVVTTTNNLQMGQQQQQQVMQQQQVPLQAPGAPISAQSQQVFAATNNAAIVQASGMAQQQLQQMPQGNPSLSAADTVQQPSMTESDASAQVQQIPAAQQVSSSAGATQDQLQASPAKQAVYFYDPKETKMSQNGEILEMPALVYDGNGKAVPLEEIRHVAPIYVQAPVLGATNSGLSGVASADKTLATPSARGSSLVSPTAKEASMKMPESWGTSTAQDQTIIVATVAVMALLVGALSARRLRSKSFLSSCIENESLEDDMAYDDAYTTTASGAMGADSSYNTFGGWKGDLEKFDV